MLLFTTISGTGASSFSVRLQFWPEFFFRDLNLKNAKTPPEITKAKKARLEKTMISINATLVEL